VVAEEERVAEYQALEAQLQGTQREMKKFTQASLGEIRVCMSLWGGGGVTGGGASMAVWTVLVRSDGCLDLPMPAGFA
jgi:hypothetical protein